MPEANAVAHVEVVTTCLAQEAYTARQTEGHSQLLSPCLFHIPPQCWHDGHMEEGTTVAEVGLCRSPTACAPAYQGDIATATFECPTCQQSRPVLCQSTICQGNQPTTWWKTDHGGPLPLWKVQQFSLIEIDIIGIVTCQFCCLSPYGIFSSFSLSVVLRYN